jgi:hypothetical protein
MSAHAINTAEDVYRFVRRLQTEAERQGVSGLAARLDDAVHLGSSGLEILGAIRQVVLENRSAIERLVGPDGDAEARQIVSFVDRAFGR